MTAGLSTTNTANGILNALRAGGSAFGPPAGTFGQLHVGDPGAAGTANVSGGSTTRVTFTQAAASGGSIALNGTAPVWTNGGATEPLTYLSVWSAITAGTFLYSIPFSGTATGGAITIGTGGVLTTATAHGLAIGDVVSLGTVVTSTGIVANTLYFVIAVGSSTTATLSATSGGSALTTTAGTGTGLVVMPKWVNGNTFTLSACTISQAPLAT